MEIKKIPLGAYLGENYKVGREIGHGGLAVVYSAYDYERKKDVALKVPKNTKYEGVFEQEARIHAGLHHPHILPFYWYGREGEHTYMSMMLVRDGAVSKKLQGGQRPSIDDAVRHILESSSAVQHAHEEGIIHRDLKSSNILLDNGKTYVSDWGIAVRMGSEHSPTSRESLGRLTNETAPPEQREMRVIPETDIYALGGVTAFELLTGRRPYIGSKDEIIRQHQYGRPPFFESVLMGNMTQLHEDIEPVVQKALSKEPEDRQRSMGDYAEELKTAYERGKAKARKEEKIIDIKASIEKLAPMKDAANTEYLYGVKTTDMASGGITEQVLVSDTREMPPDMIPEPPAPYAEFHVPSASPINFGVDRKDVAALKREEAHAVTIERAKDILGDNFYGLESVYEMEEKMSKNGKEVRFVIDEGDTALPYTEGDLQAAKVLGEKLMYRPNQVSVDGEIKPVTIDQLLEIIKGNDEFPDFDIKSGGTKWVKSGIEKKITNEGEIKNGWAFVKKLHTNFPNPLSFVVDVEDYRAKINDLTTSQRNIYLSSATEVFFDVLQGEHKGNRLDKKYALAILHDHLHEKIMAQHAEGVLYLNETIIDKKGTFLIDFNQGHSDFIVIASFERS